MDKLEPGDVVDTDLGPLVIPEGMGGHYVVSDSVDAAWAEAEAALPEGWVLGGVTLHNPGYKAFAAHRFRPGIHVYGHPTPAAALRALAVRLREREA